MVKKRLGSDNGIAVSAPELFLIADYHGNWG